jgi:hypothetical protein
MYGRHLFAVAGSHSRNAAGRLSPAKQPNSWRLGLMLSVVAHAGVAAVALAPLSRPAAAPIDVELVDIPRQDLEELPLGGPDNGGGAKPHAPARPTNRAPKVAATTRTLGPPSGDEKTNAQSGSSSKDNEAAPAAMNDLGSYGPEGSHLTMLIRLDRLRGTAYQASVDELLLYVPARRDLLEGTGLDLFADFDALLVATPDPRDSSVTFLAARYRLEETAMRAALTRGAESTDRTLVWRTEGKCLVGERRAPDNGGSAPARTSDERIVMLCQPGLAIVTPPAYRGLLLEPAASPSGGSLDAGQPGADVDGGSGRWATLLSRIDAEEGIMPTDGVVMFKAVDLFKPAGAEAGEDPGLFGMGVPSVVSATIGIDDAPFLDVVAECKTEVSALQWQSGWPVLQRRLRQQHSASLLGLSSLLDRATLTRETNVVRVHIPVTRTESAWLLGLGLQMLASHGI